MPSEPAAIKLRRADLEVAFRTLAAGKGPLILRASDGAAELSRGAMREDLIAEGSGKFAAQFEMDPAYYARRIPPGEWLDITFDGSHLAFGAYRHPAIPAVKSDTMGLADQKEKARRLARAAKTLEAYFLTEADLHQLCQTESLYTVEEQAMTERIGKAWVELAPYGVSPDALRKLITHRIRNAWDRPLKTKVKRPW